MGGTVSYCTLCLTLGPWQYLPPSLGVPTSPGVYQPSLGCTNPPWGTPSHARGTPSHARNLIIPVSRNLIKTVSRNLVKTVSRRRQKQARVDVRTSFAVSSSASRCQTQLRGVNVNYASYGSTKVSCGYPYVNRGYGRVQPVYSMPRCRGGVWPGCTQEG